MDLRFHPRTKAQREFRFVPREHGCGWLGYVAPRPKTPSRLDAVFELFGSAPPLRGPRMSIRFWEPEPEPELPPRPPDVIWDEGPGSLFD